MEHIQPIIPAGMDALGKMYKDWSKNKMFADESYLRLQVRLSKVPEVDLIKKEFLILPNPLYGENPRVCLFVPDIKSTGPTYREHLDDKIDRTIDYFQDVLNKHGVQKISTIMPCVQLLKEYDSYELRRKLANSFDVFFAEKTLLQSKKFLKGLGRPFQLANKFPLAVHFPKTGAKADTKLKKAIDKGLKTTWFYIKPYSDNYNFRVGRMQEDKEKLQDNLTSAVEKLVTGDCIPGGFNNIKGIYLKTEKSPVVPLYISLVSRNKVPVPVVDNGKPVHEAVTDELSTMPGINVTVLPSGEIFLTNDGTGDMSLSQLSDDEPFEDGSDEENPPEQKNNGKNAEDEEEDSIDEDDDDDEDEDEEEDKKAVRKVKNAETNYLRYWSEQRQEEEEKQEKEEKRVKNSKRGGKKKQSAKRKLKEEEPKEEESNERSKKKRKTGETAHISKKKVNESKVKSSGKASKGKKVEKSVERKGKNSVTLSKKKKTFKAS